MYTVYHFTFRCFSTCFTVLMIFSLCLMLNVYLCINEKHVGYPLRVVSFVEVKNTSGEQLLAGGKFISSTQVHSKSKVKLFYSAPES